MGPTPWLLATLLFTGTALADSLVLRHDPVNCVVAGRFPSLEAHVSPAREVASARIHFKAEGTGPWYFVKMTQDAEALRGVLPQPRKDLKSFRYYIDVTGTGFETSRTPEAVAEVAYGPGACEGRKAALAMSGATVLVQGGGPPLPAGFEATGLVTGTATTATGAATGPGLSATGIALIAVGAAAVAGAAVVASGDDHAGQSDASSPSSPTAPNPPTTSPSAPRTLTFTGTDTGVACVTCCLVNEFFFDVNAAGTLTATLAWAQSSLDTDLVEFGNLIVRGTSTGPTSAGISAPVTPGQHKIRIYNGNVQPCRPAGPYTLVVNAP